MTSESQAYLKDVQYRFPNRLAARAALHRRYGRGDWFDWLAANIPLPAGGLVADVGCGAGAFWREAPRSVPDDLRVRLFDLSPGMSDAAARTLAEVGRWADAKAEIADAEELPLVDGEADTVMAIHMLYHLRSPEGGIREFNRVTRQGGVVAVVLNPAGNMAELAALANQASSSTVWPEPLTSDAALPLLRATFDRVDVVRFQDELIVTDPVDVLAYLISMPLGDAPGATEKLSLAVEEAFSRSGGALRIAKAADLLLCRR